MPEDAGENKCYGVDKLLERGGRDRKEIWGGRQREGGDTWWWEQRDLTPVCWGSWRVGTRRAGSGRVCGGGELGETFQTWSGRWENKGVDEGGAWRGADTDQGRKCRGRGKS